MEQATLINQAAAFINAASAYQGKGLLAEARESLERLQALLTTELVTEAPGTDATPPPAEPR